MRLTDLDVVNGLVLDLVQAMLGSITPNFRNIFLDTTEDRVVLYFVLDHDDPADREEIDDIEFEFSALQNRLIDIDVVVMVDKRPIGELKIPGRYVYSRKELNPTAANEGCQAH